MRSRAAPSGIGVNLLNSGAITRRIQHQHQELERHPRAPRPQPPVACRRRASATARAPAAAGRARRRRRCPWRGRRATAPSVMRLKPKRSSMRNVCHQENGRLTAPKITPATANIAHVAPRSARPASVSVHSTMRREAAAQRHREEQDHVDRDVQHRERVAWPACSRRPCGARRCRCARRTRPARLAMRATCAICRAREPQAHARPRAASAARKRTVNERRSHGQCERSHATIGHQFTPAPMPQDATTSSGSTWR